MHAVADIFVSTISENQLSCKSECMFYNVFLSIMNDRSGEVLCALHIPHKGILQTNLMVSGLGPKQLYNRDPKRMNAILTLLATILH